MHYFPRFNSGMHYSARVWSLALRLPGTMACSSPVLRAGSFRRLIWVTLLATLSACSEPPQGQTLQGETMGTSYTVRLGACAESNCAPPAQALQDRLGQLTDQLSHYAPDSELSRFNRSQATDWVDTSEDLATVVDYALQVSAESGGVFDITVAPAVNAWGFGPGEQAATAPPEAALRQALDATDYEQLQARLSPPALRKQNPQLSLDLSAIAKGYAVDQVALLLETAGWQNYLVEIGGEVRTAGRRPNGTSWRIGIAPPDNSPAIEFVILPRDGAIATSGDYRNFYLLEGQRYSHAIDPATARPVTHGLASVSVVAPSAMQADALATALLIMGPEKGLAYATQHDIAALFMIRDEARIRIAESPALQPYLLRY